jgi:sterol desaturase/sphingolipid hydroxylase (fatty acid hydroxylase superfamily)
MSRVTRDFANWGSSSFDLSQRAYFADFAMAPAAIAALATVEVMRHGPTLAFIVWMALGAILWTLAEYVIHRFLFHRFAFVRDHGRHHVHPQEYIGASPLLTAVAFSGLIAMLVGVFGVHAGGGTAAGFLAGYLGYLTLHVLMHHTSWRALDRLRANHDGHHAIASSNYGVSSPFWDHAFGTYRDPAQIPPRKVRHDPDADRRDTGSDAGRSPGELVLLGKRRARRHRRAF